MCTDTEIIIKKGAQGTTAESCKAIKCAATVADNLGNVLNNRVCLYMNQNNNEIDCDNTRNTGSKEGML